MKIRNLLAVLATAWAGLSIQGCGAAPESSAGEIAPPSGASDDIGETQDPILQGVQGGNVGAVDIQLPLSACTGVLIGSRMIITTSSCFDGVLADTARRGTVAAKINYAVSGTAWKCMTGTPSNGKCTVNRNVFVARTIPSTAPRPEFDYAFVFLNASGAPWANIVPSDPAFGFYDGNFGVGTPYVFYGRGYNSTNGTGAAVMRFMTDSVDWMGADYFITDAGSARLCLADFGGPVLASSSDRWLLGIASNATMSGNCAKSGGKQRFTKSGWAMRQAIITARTEVNIPQCRPFSADFPNYWVCD
jgi:hypothetical protein